LLFNSYIFILLFLPLTFSVYFLLNRLSYRGGKVWLAGMSLWFYAYFNLYYLPIIAGSILFNYFAGKLIKKEIKINRRKLYLALSVIMNLGALFYYKYFDFFISNVNNIFKTGFTLRYLILPLAISFFTFKQIAYIVDCYRGEVPEYNFLDYTLFVIFFPQLIVGPILFHDELIPQFQDKEKKRVSYENLAKGLMAFSLGLGKKVLLADTFARAADWGYGNVEMLDTASALLVMLFYTFRIYFDFSGYCDMAIGLGLMFNITITQNFDSPYQALSVTDFWQRWHITLTRFFRRYLYIPLGGNRKGEVRTYLNLFAVFLVSGLWHGANYTFILWGAIHGFLFAVTRMFQKQIDSVNKIIRWLITFFLINLTWVYFRAESISQANEVIRKIFMFDFDGSYLNLIETFKITEAMLVDRLIKLPFFADYELYFWLMTIFAFIAIIFMKNINERILSFKPRLASMLVTVVLLIWGILSFSEITAFIYVGF